MLPLSQQRQSHPLTTNQLSQACLLTPIKPPGPPPDPSGKLPPGVNSSMPILNSLTCIFSQSQTSTKSLPATQARDRHSVRVLFSLQPTQAGNKHHARVVLILWAMLAGGRHCVKLVFSLLGMIFRLGWTALMTRKGTCVTLAAKHKPTSAASSITPGQPPLTMVVDCSVTVFVSAASHTRFCADTQHGASAKYLVRMCMLLKGGDAAFHQHVRHLVKAACYSLVFFLQRPMNFVVTWSCCKCHNGKSRLITAQANQQNVAIWHRSLEETVALLQGIEDCGGGKWADIKKGPYKAIVNRSAVSQQAQAF